MKEVILIGFLIFLISQIGCKQVTEPASPDIHISYEIESAFQNDSVKLTLDNKILMQSRVTTDYTLNLAWSSGLRKLSGNDHILHFDVVEYGVRKDFNIDIANDTSTVLLRFDKSTKQISIIQMQGRFLRD